ncbi:MAG: homoserine kinase [Myxococcota bacterium]
MSDTTPITVYAPATIANLGPGYDIIGLAITGLGDRVEAQVTDSPGVVLEAITGDEGRLPLDPALNTTTVAAQQALDLLSAPAHMGLRITLHKGLPLGSGLGSSAASAVAGAMAAACAVHQAEPRLALLQACCDAEKVAAGVAHADNVGPSLLGGVVLIRRYNPVEVITLPAPPELRLVVAMPAWSISTREAREVLPHHVPLSDAVANGGNVAAMVAGFFRGDLELIGRSMEDAIVEPVRAPLIPAFPRVKRTAIEAGALGCSISGAGPACFALAADDSTAERIAEAMEHTWKLEGIASRAHIGRVDTQGARILDPTTTAAVLASDAT